jgi:thymidylate kinase
MRGKLIVLYGANNLGKSLQVELLQKDLEKKGLLVRRIKYPIYDLKPTGPLINAILRKGKKMPEDKVQQLYVKNRIDYEPELKRALKKGIWIIAEDYVGTGIAWGMVRGVSLKFLEKINKGLYPADLSFVLYGKQFSTGIETGHRNEVNNDIWNTAQEKHLFLADRYKWNKIYANQTPKRVHKDIITIIENELL